MTETDPLRRRDLLGLAALAGVAALPLAVAPAAPAAAAMDDGDRRAWSLDPDVAGPGFTPAQRRAHILAVLEEIRVAGGGTLEWPGTEFVVDRPTAATTIWAIVPPGTYIRGRAGAALTLDPSTAPSATGMIMLQFGPLDGDGSDIRLESLRITCNQSIIGGGSLWAVGSRRPSANIHRVDDIAVVNCEIVDSRVAVCATQQTAGVDLGDLQHRRWRIEGCTFVSNTNRMIELAQVDGAVIAHNFFVEAETAIHLVSFTRNAIIIGNCGTVRDGGVRINFGVQDCAFIGTRSTTRRDRPRRPAVSSSTANPDR